MYLLSAMAGCLLLALAWQMRHQRFALTLMFTSGTFWLLWRLVPFPTPTDNLLLAVLANEQPLGYAYLKLTWAGVLLLLPCYVWFPLFSRLARQHAVEDKRVAVGLLPPYPHPRERQELFVVLGEVHHPDVMVPSAEPRWCEIPESGLSCGVLVLGAPRTGKTSSLLEPIAEQLFSYRAHDHGRRLGGLVLEVKAQFCWQVRDILRHCGRADDYLEIGYGSPFCYNPLHTDASPDTLAFRLVSVLRTISAASAEKNDRFWDESEQNFSAFLMTLFRLLHGYVTLRDVYLAANNVQLIDDMMKSIGMSLGNDYVLVRKMDYLSMPRTKSKQLEMFGFDAVDGDDNIRVQLTDEVRQWLEKEQIPFTEIELENDPITRRKKSEYESAKVFHKAFKGWHHELRTNVTATLSADLKVFDSDPEARRIFCPPADAYDAVLNRDGRFGRPLPRLSQLVESPKVLALALPAAADEKIGRIAGVMLKQDWHRAVLMRKGSHTWDAATARRLVMLIDEYHLLATAGGAKPGGDEQFLNLCRDVGCIPIVATQSLSSLRSVVGEKEKVITQGLQTTICLRQKDPDTAEWVSKVAGRREILREHWGVSENEHGVVPSITGALRGEQGSMNMSRGWNEVREEIFQPKDVHELPNGVGIALPYDGFNQLPPTLVYLQPYGGNHAVSWFTTNKKQWVPKK